MKRKSSYLYSALKKKNGVCFTFIVFMINLTNLEINYQTQFEFNLDL